MRNCIYSERTGEILRWTSHPEEPPAGYVCEQRDFDARDGYIDPGSCAFVTMPERPSPWHLWDWSVHAWVDPRTPGQQLADSWTEVRARRNALLAATDWRVAAAAESGALLAPAWREYRQALRDITAQLCPDAITWPAPPQE
jgi:hypothetical protein